MSTTTRQFTISSPFHKYSTSLSFPQLTARRGVWVVDIIGCGKRIRALIRKGGHSFIQHPTVLGHAFKIYDENGKEMNNATILLGTQSYTANDKYDDGIILMPYSAQENQAQIIIVEEEGFMATLTSFNQLTEVSVESWLFVSKT